eukprot:11212836-Alexandrium_andersonii.AAC.1
MSASLVGSEMCIRDRGGGNRPPLRGSSHGTREPPVGRPASHRGAAAVSYTHLTLPTICSV